MLFSANGTSLPSQLYNPDPTFIYRTVSGSAGEVYNHTVTAIYTETVNMSSDPLSVRGKYMYLYGVNHLLFYNNMHYIMKCIPFLGKCNEPLFVANQL